MYCIQGSEKQKASSSFQITFQLLAGISLCRIQFWAMDQEGHRGTLLWKNHRKCSIVGCAFCSDNGRDSAETKNDDLNVPYWGLKCVISIHSLSYLSTYQRIIILITIENLRLWELKLRLYLHNIQETRIASNTCLTSKALDFSYMLQSVRDKQHNIWRTKTFIHQFPW